MIWSGTKGPSCGEGIASKCRVTTAEWGKLDHPELISLWDRRQGVQCWRGNGLRKMPVKVTVGCHPSAKTMFGLNQSRCLCFSVCRPELLPSWHHCNLPRDQLLFRSWPLFPSHLSFPDFNTVGISSHPHEASGCCRVLTPPGRPGAKDGHHPMVELWV